MDGPKEFLDNFTPKNGQIVTENVANQSGGVLRSLFKRAADGNAGVWEIPDDDADESVGEIHAIYLLADYWDKGYGRQLMDFAVNRLKELSCCKVTLWVMEENNRARRFYERYGWVLDGSKGK